MRTIVKFTNLFLICVLVASCNNDKTKAAKTEDAVDAKAIPTGKKDKLEGHLKSGDFFDVETFPTATFSITSVADADTDEANCMITGNLTMKGVTKSVTFPALVVAKEDGTLTAISDKFKINRTEWGIKYGSGITGAIANEAISDNFTLQISLKAK